MRKRRVSMFVFLRTVTAIAGVALLIFFASFARSTTYATPKCFAEGWPDGIESGQTHFTYRVTNSCEIADAKFLISEPPGAFDEAGLCMARVSYPYGSMTSARILTWEEYQAELQEYREANPERFHDRTINVKTKDGIDAQITCYFNEDWEPTEAEIGYYIDDEFRVEPFSDFDWLPVQHHKMKWEVDK